MYHTSGNHTNTPPHSHSPGRAATWRSTLLAILPAVAATALLLSLSGCDTASRPDAATAEQATEKSPSANPSLAVEITQPQPAVWSKTIPASGDIAAWETASAGPESMGLTIRRVLVREGDYVKKGQVLATFSGTTIRAQAAQAQAGLEEARAAAADARANAVRMKKLVETGFMSTVQYNQYQTAAETAQARVAAAQAVVQQQRIRLGHTTLRAPVAGTISHSGAVAGTLTSAGQNLFTIIRDGRLEWRAQVTAEQLTQINPGTKVAITLPGNVHTTGTVRTTSPTVDARTRNATVYVDLPSDSPARMGMFASGSFATESVDVLTLPQTAIVFRDGFSHLVEVQQDNTVRIIRIETGGQQDAAVSVSGDVRADARYVLRGGAFLNNGDTVRVISDTDSSADTDTDSSTATSSGGTAAATPDDE